jgi:hypothetical protein
LVVLVHRFVLPPREDEDGHKDGEEKACTKNQHKLLLLTVSTVTTVAAAMVTPA